MAPKIFVNFATATAVGHYNAGYELTDLCDKFGIETLSGLIKYLKNEEQENE